MTFRSLIEESRDVSEGFYVPALRIQIEGSSLPGEVLRDVSSFTYRDSIDEIDSIELAVNNWDAEHGRFKYVGAETEETLAGIGEGADLHRVFDPCHKKVVVRLGYGSRQRVMLTGTFTTVEPNFPQSGGPTLTVRGLNELHQLRRKKYTSSWGDKTDSQIAEEIGGLQDEGEKRFPLPVRINERAASGERPLVSVTQDNMFDIDFLLSRARRRSYVVKIVEADEVLGIERHLYFGPSETETPINYRLEWGKSLIEFRPTLTTANQFKSVTVRGWNRQTREAIVATASLENGDVEINQDLRELLMECDPREEYVVDRPVYDEGEARDLAEALLRDRNKNMVKAAGKTIGLPGLVAGSRVEIVGFGSRLSGVYFVTDTTHSFDDSGYMTSFNARREDPEGAAI